MSTPNRAKINPTIDLSKISLKDEYVKVASEPSGTTVVNLPKDIVHEAFYDGLEERGVDRNTYRTVKQYEKDFNRATYEHGVDLSIDLWKDNPKIEKINIVYPTPENNKILIRANPNEEHRVPGRQETSFSGTARIVVKQSTGVTDGFKRPFKEKINKALADMGRELGKK